MSVPEVWELNAGTWSPARLVDFHLVALCWADEEAFTLSQHRCHKKVDSDPDSLGLCEKHHAEILGMVAA